MEVRWSVSRADIFVRRTWADEAVIYNCDTGETHVLEPLALEILTQFDSVPHDQSTLKRHLGQHFLFPSEVDVDALLVTTLAKLENIGLIEIAT